MATNTSVKATAGAASIAVGPILIALWKEAPTVPVYRSVVQEELDRLIATFSSGVCYLAIVLPSSGVPAADVRALVQADLVRWGPKLRHTVTVAVGDSLREALVRTLMTTIMFLSRQSTAHTIAKLPKEGIAVLRAKLGDSAPSVEALEEGVAKVYAA